MKMPSLIFQELPIVEKNLVNILLLKLVKVLGSLWKKSRIGSKVFQLYLLKINLLPQIILEDKLEDLPLLHPSHLTSLRQCDGSF